MAFAATGRPPFGIRPLAAVLARVRTADADLDGLDAATAAALGGALQAEPDQRSTPERTVAALRAAGAGGTEVVEGPAMAATLVAPVGEPTEVVPLGPAAPPPAPAEGDGQETVVLAAGDGAPRATRRPTRDDGAPARDGDDEPVRGRTGGRRARSGRGRRARLGRRRVRLGADRRAGPRAARRPRPSVGSVLAIGVLLATAGSGWPGIALAVAVGLAVLARSVGLDVQAVQARRERRGERRGETARAVAGWPWYLLRAVLGVVPAALVAASAVVVVGGVGWWGIGTGRWPIAPLAPGEVSGGLPGTQAWVERALLVLAVVIGLLLVWFGPMSRTTRLGARFALAAVAPPRGAAVALVLLALAAAGVLATMVVLGQDVVWWPLPGPPDLG